MNVVVFCASCLVEMEFEIDEKENILYCRCPNCEREMRQLAFEAAYEPPCDDPVKCEYKEDFQ